MPIYEYQCQECEHLFDALQKINEKPLLDCPSCGEDALKRLISAPNFRLKGKVDDDDDGMMRFKIYIRGRAIDINIIEDLNA